MYGLASNRGSGGRVVRIMVAVAAAASAATGHVYADQNSDGDNAVGNFSFNNNWFGDSEPSWNFASGSLNFAFSNNQSQTSLFFDYGGWRTTNDIFWLSTYGKSTVLSSNGNGIDFTIRLENQSNFAQTINMPMSGGKNGVDRMELNPRDADLTINGPLYNDNSVDYQVWGSPSSTLTTLTLSSALGVGNTAANVDFNVQAGRNSLVNVLASQVWAGTTTVNSGSFTTGSGVTIASPTIVVAGGTVTTASANTFVDSAALTVNSGRLSIGGSDTVASLAGTGGTVDLAAGATLTAGDANSTSYAGSITGSGNLTKVGSGTFTLSAASSYTGATTVSAGQFSLGGVNLLADTSAVSVTGGVLALGDHSETVGSFAISGGSLTGSGTMTAATYALAGGAVEANLGAGTMDVTGNTVLNGKTLATVINLNSGTLTLGSLDSRRLAATTAAVSGSAGASLSLGWNETIGSLAGAADVNLGGGRVLNVGGANTSTTYSGVISGYGGLSKLGSGTFTLQGNNTYYTGGTVVSAGRLSVNGSLGNTKVQVLTGAEVGGAGSIGGPMDVRGGGTLSPGDSIESLAVGNTIFASSATFEYEYDSTNPAALAAAADLLVVSGSLTINSGAILTLADLAVSPNPFADSSTIFALINYSGTWNNGLFTYNGTALADGSRFFVGSQEWEIDYNRTSSAGLDNFTGDYVSGNFVTITAVPEPSTCAIALAGLACGGYVVFRRRKRA